MGDPTCPLGSQDCKLGTYLSKTERAQWEAGSTAEVGFALIANHGGGYAWRLCPAKAEQTEECFQKHHLKFSGSTTTALFTNGKKETFPSITLSSGTHPSNSQWRAIQIPGNVQCGDAPYACKKSVAPCPGCEMKFSRRLSRGSNFSMVDRVEVPSDLPLGEYTLSWRWDSELTNQVWQSCADIEIVGGGPAPAPTPQPTPEPTPEPVPSPSPEPSPSCSFYQDHGCSDKNTIDHTNHVGSKGKCCDLCMANPECTHFKLTTKNECYLKAGDMELISESGYVIGTVQRDFVL